MPNEREPTRICFLALPHGPDSASLKDAVRRAARKAGFRAVSLEDQLVAGDSIGHALIGQISRADCIIADVTQRNPNVFYELGLAQAMGKGSVLLVREDAGAQVPADIRGFQYIPYAPTAPGLAAMGSSLTRALEQYRRAPERARAFVRTRVPTPFFVDWDRIGPRDVENLCRELLAQMGFQRIDWVRDLKEVDLVAQVPKKDPDGFEYRELWLVSMGVRVPPEVLLDMAGDPGYLLHRITRGGAAGERLLDLAQGGAVTLLLILPGPELSTRAARLLDERERRILPLLPGHMDVRVRVWDRAYLTSLVQQFPQIGYKYFSDEARSQSKYCKTPEELYSENVSLTDRLVHLNADLESERGRRIRAERDSVWKDISFSAAHKLGNPIFAIETNLDPLEKRVRERRITEALEVASSIRASIELDFIQSGCVAE